jgi:hypothetical protein
MKMGTIRSLCPYDAAARDALQSANLRRPAILRYASWAAVFPISRGWSGYPERAKSIDCGFEAFGRRAVVLLTAHLAIADLGQDFSRRRQA